MARRDEPLSRRLGDARIAAGIAALVVIVLLAGGALGGLGLEAGRDWRGAAAAFDPYMLRVVRFTLLQAILSTVLSVGPAILVARALSRHPDFLARDLILRMFGLPLALPAIVVALAVLALYGRAGFVVDLLPGGRADAWPGIYGLAGILVAHVFFNLPLATRLLLQALDSVPADQWRLSSQLGLNAWTSFRFVEWPVLRSSVPGVAGLVFMLCVTSFTIVLILGGGPAATTLEVAIYQALRFDFDPARALGLTVVQIALTAGTVGLMMLVGAPLTGDANLPVSSRRYHGPGGLETAMNAILIVVALVFVAAPLAAILAAGLTADLVRLITEAAVLRATATSLVLSSMAAVLALVLSLALVAARRRLAVQRPAPLRSFFEWATATGAGFILVLPPIVIGAGWFILLRGMVDLVLVAPFMVVTVNAAMAMPFAVRAIRPAYDAADERHERLCSQLGIKGLDRFRLVDWPVLRRPILTGFAFAMALSLGDLGVIALFGSDMVQTLPYLLLARMSSYRTADAAGLALLLALFCLALMSLADTAARMHPKDRDERDDRP